MKVDREEESSQRQAVVASQSKVWMKLKKSGLPNNPVRVDS